ncbi:hypothetical protein GYMLUDRAFT_99365 [Collybiopsis luxurians FD-317 M1]|uniref:Unplaced genomic scaffold GYMLUscaffold_53, whole genome shotgun sequence n=1 Tax=Collybiopsis luxurians FD-317 M1 TaxID=944289 RepID=A0A0D0AYY6_9AGAR|nr:hypothetical protein GYMLUDRAFT_99365 [Collybiopsis luxurians FD-317 M1]
MPPKSNRVKKPVGPKTTAGETSRKLAHLLRLIFRFPVVVTPIERTVGDDVELSNPPLLARLNQVNVVPFWLETCPPEHVEKWGSDWARIRTELTALSRLQNKTDVDRYKWSAHGLDEVSSYANRWKWPSAMDDPIRDLLESENMGIRKMYTDSSNYNSVMVNPSSGEVNKTPNGFLSSTVWDSSLAMLIPKLFACQLPGPPLPVVFVEWWHSTIQANIDAIAKYRSRMDSALEDNLSKARQILGESMWTTLSLPMNLSVNNAIAALDILQRVKDSLDWTVTSEEDEEIRSQPINLSAPDAAEQVKSRWERLSENARKQDWAEMMIGFLVGVVGARGGKEIVVDFGDESEKFDYGVVLARAVPPKILKERVSEPTGPQIAQFGHQVADFTDAWLGRSQVDNLDTALALYFDPDFEAAASAWIQETGDIGVEKLKDTPTEDLHLSLGYAEGLPITFRKYTADDSRGLPDNDEPFTGSTPVVISWHQLVFVRWLFSQMAIEMQAPLDGVHHSPNVEIAPLAIRKLWSKTPGICLFDEVGLGKTMCAMASIATIQTIFELQQAVNSKVTPAEREQAKKSLPACVREANSFGGHAEGIPNNAHLIIVPPSLLHQWAGEIMRFYRSRAIRLVIVSSAAKHWAEDMRRIRDKSVEPGRTLVLITHTVLKRMFSLNRNIIVHSERQGLPRLHYQLPTDTVYSFSWCSAWIDEAHEARKGNLLWKSMSAVFELTLVKVVMTATPLLESPNDLVQLSMLIRPPSMDWAQQANMTHMGRDLRILKTKSMVNSHQEALKLGESSTLLAETEGNAVAAMATQMVKVSQRHIIPHTMRRSNKSVDYQGNLLNSSLPTKTVIHISIEVTENERNDSYSGVENAVAAKKFDVATHGRFFLKGRQALSFTSDDALTIDGYTEDVFLATATTKHKALIELCQRLLTQGSETVVSSSLAGTTDRIVDSADLSIPDVIHHWAFKPITPEEKKHGEKVIVYTVFQKYHEFMLKSFAMAGINAVAISGAIHAAERTRVIERFKTSTDIDVLLMSIVGQQGLNLTVARNLILYEANWSAVQSQQLYGRIHRRGQERKTFIFQLMGAKTVEVLLIANGLGKGQLLQDFMTVERNQKTLKLLAGRASAQEYDELLSGNHAPSDIAQELAEKLPKANSIMGKAMRARKQALDGSEVAPPTKRKRASKQTTELNTHDSDSDNPSKPARKQRKRQQKSKEVVDSSDHEDKSAPPKRRKSGVLAPGPKDSYASTEAGGSHTSESMSTPAVLHEGVTSQTGVGRFRVPVPEPSQVEASNNTMDEDPTEPSQVEASNNTMDEDPTPAQDSNSGNQDDNWALGPDGKLKSASAMTEWRYSPSSSKLLTPPPPSPPLLASRLATAVAMDVDKIPDTLEDQGATGTQPTAAAPQTLTVSKAPSAMMALPPVPFSNEPEDSFMQDSGMGLSPLSPGPSSQPFGTTEPIPNQEAGQNNDGDTEHSAFRGQHNVEADRTFSAAARGSRKCREPSQPQQAPPMSKPQTKRKGTRKKRS